LIIIDLRQRLFKNMNYKYLAKENIIQRHKKIIEATGGEKGMLKFSRAGILSRGIISGHPFVDGNKRAGFEATDIF